MQQTNRASLTMIRRRKLKRLPDARLVTDRVPLRALATALCLLTPGAATAQAACYADYRAKMDNPLRLHYGVIDLPAEACDPTAAAPVIAGRLAADGWELLQVISIFGEDGLATRRADAGQYYLRF
jgi:hypothetical protein